MPRQIHGLTSFLPQGHLRIQIFLQALDPRIPIQMLAHLLTIRRMVDRRQLSVALVHRPPPRMLNRDLCVKED